MLEIYRERLQDLLAEADDDMDPVKLKIKEHPVKGVYVDGLSKEAVGDAEEVRSICNLQFKIK